MGSSTQTPKVALPQFADNDKPTWRGDLNDAFAKIDAEFLAIDSTDIIVDASYTDARFDALLTTLASSGRRAYIPPQVTVSLSANHVIPGKVTIVGPGVILDTRTNPTNELFTIGVAASGTTIACRLYGSVSGSYKANHHAIVVNGTDNGAGVAPTYITGVVVNCPEIKGFGSVGVFGEFVQDSQFDFGECHHMGYGGVIIHSANNVTSHVRTMHDIGPGTTFNESYGVQFDRRDQTSDLVRYPRSLNCQAHIDVAYACPNIHALGTHGGKGISLTWGSMNGVNRPIDIVCSTDDNHTAFCAPHDVYFEGDYADSGVTDGSFTYGIVIAGAFKNTDALGSPTEYATSIVGKVGILRGYGSQNDSSGGAVYCHSTLGMDIEFGVVREASPFAVCLYHDNKNFTIGGLKVIDSWSTALLVAGMINVASYFNVGKVRGASSAVGGKTAAIVMNRGIVVANDPSNVISVGPDADFSGTTVPESGPLLIPTMLKAPLQAIDGDTSTPSITFASDPDTGIFHRTAGDVGIAAGGTTPLHITSTGMYLADSVDISLGQGTGTRIGVGATQKLAFYGNTPIVQRPSTAPQATDLASAIALVNELRADLRAYGLKL